MTAHDFNQLSHEVQLAYTYRAGTYVARRWDENQHVTHATFIIYEGAPRGWFLTEKKN